MRQYAFLLWVVFFLLIAHCRAATEAAPIEAAVRGGRVVIRTAQAEFGISPSGYVSAFLLTRGRHRLTLDDPRPGGAADRITVDGAVLPAFETDLARVRVTDAGGPIGKRGRRVEVPAVAKLPGGGSLERRAVFEAYEDFPALLLETVTYTNRGAAPLKVTEVTVQRHRLNAALQEATARPFQLWSFHGASMKWGQDDVVALSERFFRPNPMGVAQADGNGGGVPVVALWGRRAGIAVGHLDTLPLALAMPVRVADDGHAQVAITLQPGVTLQPGQSFSTPVTFAAVYAGDYYEPLRAYSLALQREGWKLPEPSDEAYNVSWCGWGYEFDVTAREMLGVIPKLKELGIKWATLDDRWFDTYGDWNPRSDTFPGGSLREMVEEYHKDGILVQLWWVPLGAEIPGPKYPSHTYIRSAVAKEHPDWLVLDREGKPALMTRQLATLCPALPAVRDYHRRLTEKFIRDWGFDGHKLDNIFSVPPCYNPAHGHKSPDDSVNAMGEVYRVIFDTTRALKPYAVTQACPCGTPPNIAWLPYLDQAVTADPVGSAQVRRRVKMYKALLGPRAAVYGDHVELTEVSRKAGRVPDSGSDFASSVGTGAVPGTKFVWPQAGPKFKQTALTPEKDGLWKKWMEIYRAKMLSRGEFRNLYTIGYDQPEGYAIEKDGAMYYAFFAPFPDETWKGTIELRGLKPGTYRVTDYVHNRELGVVDARNPRVRAEFAGSLLVEARSR